MEQRFIDEAGLAYAFSKLKADIDSKPDASELVKKSGDTMTGSLKAPELSTDNATIGTELVYDSVNGADRELASISLTESDDYGNYSVKMGFDPKYEEESADSVTHPAIKFERDGIVTKIASRAAGGASGGLLVLENDDSGDVFDVRVRGVADPVNDTDAVNKRYLEQRIREVLDAMASAPDTCTVVVRSPGGDYFENFASELSIEYKTVSSAGVTVDATATLDDVLYDEGSEDYAYIELTVACGTELYIYGRGFYPDSYSNGVELELDGETDEGLLKYGFVVSAAAGSSNYIVLSSNS